ncbi:radical SAM family heme chaperone HemW [bacterium]|nr:radical SAM family heme chaperone HemW [bacterium]
MTPEARGFGIYIHWPYCSRICPYCDFNVFVARRGEQEPLIDAVRADLRGWRERTGPRAVRSLFLGGGTPSLLHAHQVRALIEDVDRLWGFEPEPEITLEANPDERGRLADFASAGVGRLSLGVQALDDERLSFLGRTHSAHDARAAFDLARSAFRSISVDLIYGGPVSVRGGGASAEAWTRELRDAIRLGPDHLSLYQLTVEPGAAFAREVRKGKWRPLDDDAAADLYDVTEDVCSAAGFAGYEISNHARSPSHISRHNRVYWRSGDWAGVGPGAHGRLTSEGVRRATEAPDRPADYVAAVNTTGWGAAVAEPLTTLDIARERVAMGLRLLEGLPATDVEELGLSFDTAGLKRSLDAGWLTETPVGVRLTRSGRLVADHVAGLISP